MTTGKAGTAASQPSPVCCMCGDYGLSNELFICKVCQFRSQHRYCSNLYPKAESYKVCNWCLSQMDDAAEKTQNSSNSSSSSSSYRNNGEDHDRVIIKNKKKNSVSGNHGGLKGHHKGITLQLQVSGPIKKQRSPEGLPSAEAARKRITTVVEERPRRTKSEEITNGGMITKQVFRNKVRRYKLLDEVSSQ